MGGRGNAGDRNSESWRDENPKYQQKTLGDVYFYSVKGPYPTIEPELYKKLPKYAQKSVVQLHGSGVSISGWFMTDDGLVYMNHTNDEFIGQVRLYKELWKDAKGYHGKVDEDVRREIVT